MLINYHSMKNFILKCTCEKKDSLKIHVFKIRKVEKRYLSDWVNGSAHTCGPYFERSFPYHHHCCMVQMRSDGRWLCASVTPYKKSKKNVCLNALLLCDLETGHAKRNGERVKCLGLIWSKRKIINVLFRNIVVVFVCNEIILLWKFFEEALRDDIITVIIST